MIGDIEPAIVNVTVTGIERETRTLLELVARDPRMLLEEEMAIRPKM
jgi:hypothetical protein